MARMVRNGREPSDMPMHVWMSTMELMCTAQRGDVNQTREFHTLDFFWPCAMPFADFGVMRFLNLGFGN